MNFNSCKWSSVRLATFKMVRMHQVRSFHLGAQNFDIIRFSTYRTACKLRFIQKKLNCKCISLLDERRGSMPIWIRRRRLGERSDMCIFHWYERCLFILIIEAEKYEHQSRNYRPLRQCWGVMKRTRIDRIVCSHRKNGVKNREPYELVH